MKTATSGIETQKAAGKSRPARPGRRTKTLEQIRAEAEKFLWDDKPIRSIGYRYGYAPENERSWNAIENGYEDGVSMASVAGLPDNPLFATAELSQELPRKYYEGDVLNLTGGDDELLMINLKQITEKEYKRRVRMRKYREHAVLFQAHFIYMCFCTTGGLNPDSNKLIEKCTVVLEKLYKRYAAQNGG